MHQGKCYIGTSGWIYRHWKDRFYPADVRQRDWLSYYARHFATVEVNGSFYRKPTATAVQGWQEAVPPEFRFAVKMWRGVTHYRRLRESTDLLEKFLPAIDELKPARRGPLLVQLPHTMKPDPGRLDAFLSDLKRAAGRPGWKVAMEFRSRDWVTAEIYRILDRHDAAVCLHDMPDSAITQPNEASFIYMRRHGPSGPFWGRYDPQQIQADAAMLEQWSAAGREVFIYYNNDLEGYAVENARQLMEAVDAKRK